MYDGEWYNQGMNWNMAGKILMKGRRDVCYISRAQQGYHYRLPSNIICIICRSARRLIRKWESDSIQPDFPITLSLEIWYAVKTPRSDCPCLISSQCCNFCGCQTQRSRKNVVFTAFQCICPCLISSQCCNFCECQTQKNTKNVVFSEFYYVTKKNVQSTYLHGERGALPDI